MLHLPFLIGIPAFNYSPEILTNSLYNLSNLQPILLLLKPGEPLFNRKHEALVAGAGPTQGDTEQPPVKANKGKPPGTATREEEKKDVFNLLRNDQYRIKSDLEF